MTMPLAEGSGQSHGSSGENRTEPYSAGLLSKEKTMEMKRVDAMEMSCAICGERTEQVYDLHLPGDEVALARLGLCDNDKAALARLPSEERNTKLIEAMRRANFKPVSFPGEKPE
jgi:hypothetical protein